MSGIGIQKFILHYWERTGLDTFAACQTTDLQLIGSEVMADPDRDGEMSWTP